ncbi:MAG: hypothetical protein OQK35_03270 [Alphaproteobacteria bacterium]|nr:hypothetical protein [Rhodospirillales bacterium]MCW9045332.1 hypothetical protein [Alphaproteobacteria bacterium]
MELLFVVSSEKGGEIAKPLAAACLRKGVSWACFFTNDGVRTLTDSAFCDLLHESANEAIVCAQSWKDLMDGLPCPLEIGSQFDHAGLIAKADKVISL